MSVLFLRATLLLLALTFVSADEDHEYTNDFAVEIDGDMSVADLVAGTHNLRVVRQVRFQTVCENTPIYILDCWHVILVGILSGNTVNNRSVYFMPGWTPGRCGMSRWPA